MFWVEEGLFCRCSRAGLRLLLALFVGFCWALPVQAEQSVGQVIFAVGDVTFQRAEQRIDVERGLAVFVGDTIVSGPDGHVHLLMHDRGFFSIRPNSKLTLESYHYNPADHSKNRVKIRLDQGVLRSITGRAGQTNKQQYRLNTPVAAIGVRGTDYSVHATDQFSRLSVRRGGVVMTPFGGGCVPAASGPCDGAGAAELFAEGSGALLEVRRGAENAVINDHALSPDQVSPPLPEEQNLLNRLTQVLSLSFSQQNTPVRTERADSDVADNAGGANADEPADEVVTGTPEGVVAADNGGGSEPEAGPAELNSVEEVEALADSPQELAENTAEEVEELTDSSQELTEDTAEEAEELTDSSQELTENTAEEVEVLADSSQELTENNTTDVANETIDFAERREHLLSYIEGQPLVQLVVEVAMQSGDGPLPNDAGRIAAPAIVWGRWSTYAGADENYKTIAQLLYSNRRYAAVNSVFGMLETRVDDRPLPNSGRTFFKLNSYEAYVKRGEALEGASLSNASLLIDFDESRFATHMNFDAASVAETLSIVGSGEVRDNGFFSSDSGAPAAIQGVFSPGADEAGYLFEYNLAPGVDATGATHWINADR